VKELLIYHSQRLGLTFYEVVPATFVQADSLVNATKAYQEHGGSIGRDEEGLRQSFPDVQLLRPNPRELRNFTGGGPNEPFELIPGHAVFAPNREWAERMYKGHCETGADPRTYGAKIDDAFLRTYRVTDSVFILNYNKYGIPLSPDEPHKVTLWQGEHGYPYWEVTPGTFVHARSAEQALRRYEDDPHAWGEELEEIDEEITKTGFTGPVPPPLAVSPNWERRFVDVDADMVWLMRTPEGKEVLVYGDSPEEALEEIGDVMDTPQRVVERYGPLVELFESGGVSEPFKEWPPPWSFAIKTTVQSTKDTVDPMPSQAHKETEMPMELNPDGSITATGGGSTFSEEEQAGRKRPMALDTLKDGHGRTWYHLPNGKWLCDAELRRDSRSATGAWEYWRDSGFDTWTGHRKGDMSESYGPMTSPSLDVVEEEGINFGSTFDITQHCRCANRDTLSEEKEEAKQLKVGSYTHCIDCGKLRP
jgi:hypothetical protein